MSETNQNLIAGVSGMDRQRAGEVWESTRVAYWCVRLYRVSIRSAVAISLRSWLPRLGSSRVPVSKAERARGVSGRSEGSLARICMHSQQSPQGCRDAEVIGPIGTQLVRQRPDNAVDQALLTLSRFGAAERRQGTGQGVL